MRLVPCGEFWFLRVLKPVRYAKNRNKNTVRFQRIGWKSCTVCVGTGGERASAGKSDEKQRVTSVTYSKVRTISCCNTAEELTRTWRGSRKKNIPYGVNWYPVREIGVVLFEVDEWKWSRTVPMRVPYGMVQCKFPASQLKYRTVFQIEVPYGSAKMFPYGSNMSPVRYIAMQFFPVAIEIPYGVWNTNTVR